MSMSDCEKCWNTLCTCGWEYMGWPPEALEKQAAMLRNLAQLKRARTNPLETGEDIYVKLLQMSTE